MRKAIKVGSITVERAAKAAGGKIYNFGVPENTELSGVCTDSREAEEGDLFVAIPGENTDGHKYIAQAVKNGALCVIGERLPENAFEMGSFAFILCERSIDALCAIAYNMKKSLSFKTVAITGSVGKTTTKEIITAVLGEKYRVHKTDGNHNTDIGISLCLLEMPPETEIAVLEMGMSGFGEIARMSDIAEPDVSVITNIGSSHIEMLGSRENICKAKMEIVKGMKREGEVVLNGDEPLLWAFRKGEYNPSYVSVYNREAEYRAVNIRYDDMRTKFDMVCADGMIKDLEIPALGQHHVYGALFACAVGNRLGLSYEEIKAGLTKFRNAAMRQSVYDIGGITVIDGSYNASPESMKAAIDVLCELSRQRGARKIALLGDMRELGEETRILHEEIGRYCAEKKIDKLFTFGVAAYNIALAAEKAGMPKADISCNLDVTDPGGSAGELLKCLKEGDILLVKASRALATEKIVNYLKESIN